MSPIIKGVLKEELDRSLSLKKRYELKLKEYPPGYLLVRKRGKKVYYYLSYRKDGRVQQKYLGVLSPDAIKDYKKQIADKKNLSKQLSKVKSNIQYLQRLLRKRAS